MQHNLKTFRSHEILVPVKKKHFFPTNDSRDDPKLLKVLVVWLRNPTWKWVE